MAIDNRHELRWRAPLFSDDDYPDLLAELREVWPDVTYRPAPKPWRVRLANVVERVGVRVLLLAEALRFYGTDSGEEKERT